MIQRNSAVDPVPHLGETLPMGAPLPRSMEAALAAAPDESAGYLVAADWLQAHGDPHGELITLMFDLEREQSPARFLALKRRRDELLHLHGERWLSGAHLEAATWRWGFVLQARLQVEHLPALLGSRAGRLVRELEVHGPLEELGRALAAAPPPVLQGLALAGTRRDRPLRLTEALAPIGGLSRLGIFGADVDLAGLDASRLLDLRLRDLHHPSVTPFLARLGGAPLRHLELSLDAPLELKTQVAAALPALQTLRLEDDLANELAAWAAVAPRSSRLARLALCGPMTDAGLDALLGEAARLQGVALSLEGGRFDVATRRLAHRQLPRLEFHRLRAPEPWWAEPGRGRPAAGPRR